MRKRTFAFLLFSVPAVLLAQRAVLSTAQAANTVQSTGSATVIVNPPEQAQFSVGVVTQANSADAAVQQNATISTAVQNALQALLGVNGTLQTVDYSVSARYSGNPSMLTGYSCTNTVMVTTYNIANVGKLIDAASQAGANSIGSIGFGLRNPDPYVQQALNQASKQALAHAAAIAAGLGAKTGPVIAALEGYSSVPIVNSAAGAGATATTTPVQTTGVNVTATVTVTVQLVQ